MSFSIIKKSSAGPIDQKSREAREILHRIAIETQSSSASLIKKKDKLDSRARQLRAKRDAREGRATERAVSRAALSYLADKPSGEATVQEIRQALARYIVLSVADRTPSESRGGEETWIQLIRNIISHREMPGNFIREGLLEYAPPACLRITQAGRRALAQTMDPNEVETGA